MPEIAGLFWILVAIGFVAAGIAMAYGVIQTRKTRREERPLNLAEEEDKARRLAGQK